MGKFNKKKEEMSEDEIKIDHINRCEFCRGTKPGLCPTISKEEFNRLKEQCGSKGIKQVRR